MRLVPNQLVELHLETAAGPLVLRSRIEDVFDDVLVVGAPLHKGVLVPIRTGSKLNIEFKSKESVQEGRFKNVAVVEKRSSTGIPVLQVRLLGDWEKTQERRFVRVPVFIDAVFVPIQDGEELQARTGVILNLSGGGFLLRASFSFRQTDEIRISFSVDKQPVLAHAYLARFVPTEIGFDYGFCFSEIPEQLRMDIIRYVYKRQIELRSMAREESSALQDSSVE